MPAADQHTAQRRRARLSPRLAAALAGAAVLLLLAGCGDQSTVDPGSPQSRDIARLWWWMLGAAAVVFAGALAMLVLAWRRRREEGLPLLGSSERAATTLVLVFGIGVPVVVLTGLFGWSDLGVLPETNAPDPGSTRLTVTVTGHQWFWEVRYGGSAAVTANEIHIPARTRVNVVARTADVIHSLWVPELNRKVDTIPGRGNRILWYADRPGRYRGQCSEFCGLQHANMGLEVVAQPPAAFRAWLARQAAPAPRPTTPAQQAGEQVFMANACASCHTIRGTPAAGRIGPDLTHVKSRATLAALTIPDTDAELAAWIRDPQRIKPGNKMPGLDLSAKDFALLDAYLESLR
jgi:cytochrome c oxidase subunit II